MKFRLLAASFFVLSATSFAAPRSGSTPAKPVLDATPAGVNITPITRNESASKWTFQLAKDGKALAPIVISEKAGAQTKLAAAELQKYLSQISGAKFEIETGNGENGMVLGTREDFSTPALDKALEIVHGLDGREAYAIRTRDKRILLLGATDLAASHAAYRFLEELGCRWFFQSDAWQIIPSIRDLKFAKEITDRPTFLSRRIWYGWSIFGDAGHPQNTPEHPRSAFSDYADWARRNRMAAGMPVNVGHVFEAIARENAAEFEKHPEYWALVGGKRQGPQFELGNPGLRKLVVDYAIDFFKKNPDADMVSVDPADGGGVSESPEAKAYAEANDAPFKLANEVAVAVRKAFPNQNKMVGLLAYNWHSDPPPFQLEPNIYVQMTMGFNAGKFNLDQLFEEWPKKAKNLGFYDYYSVWRWDYDMWPGGRASNKNYLVDQIRRFQKTNQKSGAYATSIDAESSNNWGPNGRGYYLANKLMWNPDQDADAILEDFYNKAFGAGAKHMKAYYSVADNPPPMSAGVYGALFRHVHAASEATKNDAVVQRRLDDIKNYLNYVYLNQKLGAEGDGAKKAELQQRIWTDAHRARYDYMTHWNAILLDSIKDLHGDPNFPRPWKVETPILHEETEELFQEGLKSYPELKIPSQVTFSKELVVVNLGGERKGFVSPNYLDQGGGTRVLFHSYGAPIRLKSTSVLMYWGGQRSWTLKNSKGEVVKTAVPPSTREGDPVPPETSVEISIPVPAPGVYEFSYNDLRDQWKFETKADQAIAFPVSTNIGTTTLGGSTPDLYFYVPKGTAEINYYFSRAPWSNSGPHTVVAPDGSIQKTVTDADNGSYISVPVPAGMDGKAWHFTSPQGSPQGFGLSNFHFFNVPNVLSASTAAMILPQDVAQKDGLKILK